MGSDIRGRKWGRRRFVNIRVDASSRFGLHWGRHRIRLDVRGASTTQAQKSVNGCRELLCVDFVGWRATLGGGERITQNLQNLRWEEAEVNAKLDHYMTAAAHKRLREVMARCEPKRSPPCGPRHRPSSSNSFLPPEPHLAVDAPCVDGSGASGPPEIGDSMATHQVFSVPQQAIGRAVLLAPVLKVVLSLLSARSRSWRVRRKRSAKPAEAH